MLNIVARENVKALRKDVIAKCTARRPRKRKSLTSIRKQERMKPVGSVEIPQKRSSGAAKSGQLACLFLLLLLWHGVVGFLTIFSEKREAKTQAAVWVDTHQLFP